MVKLEFPTPGRSSGQWAVRVKVKPFRCVVVSGFGWGGYYGVYSVSIGVGRLVGWDGRYGWGIRSSRCVVEGQRERK